LANQLLQECIAIPFLQYAPLLATKTINAALLRAKLALVDGDAEGAKSWLRRGADAAEQSVSQDWRATFGDLEHQPLPAFRELAEVLEMTLEEVKTSLNNTGRHISMDAPLREGDDSGTMMDVMRNDDMPSPLESLMTDSLRAEIERSLSALAGREADVIRLYFGLNNNQPHTLEEIGQKFDLTRERVRQIKEKAIRKLKTSSRSEILKTYLG
jgi:RNA polymerase sigma factor (sigma-70 family)